MQSSMKFNIVKSDIVEFISFEDLVSYGLKIIEHQNINYSFNYKGYMITPYTKDIYLTPKLDSITKNDVLVIDKNGEIYPIAKEIFKKIYAE